MPEQGRWLLGALALLAVLWLVLARVSPGASRVPSVQPRSPR